jgi:hypothetical protein
VINRTRWGIIARGVFTSTGRDELRAAFIRKSDAEAFLKQCVPNAKERRARYEIQRIG